MKLCVLVLIHDECRIRCSHRMQSSTSPRYKVRGRYSTYQMAMSMAGRSCKLVLSLNECQMRCYHRKNSSSPSGRYLTHDWKCVLVLIHDECQMRCSHRMQSSKSPGHKVRGRSMTYQICYVHDWKVMCIGTYP